MNRRGFLKSVAIGAGAVAAAPLLSAFPAPVQPTVLATDGWAPEAYGLRAGDMFTIAGVYATNPLTGRETKHPQHFVATANVTSGDVPCMPFAPSVRLDYVQPAGSW